MSRLVLITAAELENLIYKLGFIKIRQMLRDILREINISVDEYNELIS